MDQQLQDRLNKTYNLITGITLDEEQRKVNQALMPKDPITGMGVLGVLANSQLGGAIGFNYLANEAVDKTATDDRPVDLNIDDLTQLAQDPRYVNHIQALAGAKTERELNVIKAKGTIINTMTEQASNMEGATGLGITASLLDPANIALAVPTNALVGAVGKAMFTTRLATAGLVAPRTGMTMQKAVDALWSPKMPMASKNLMLRDMTVGGALTPTLGALKQGIKMPMVAADVTLNVAGNVGFGAVDAKLRSYEHTEEQMALEAGMGAFFPLIAAGLGRVFSKTPDPYLPAAPAHTAPPANPVIFVDGSGTASHDLAAVAAHQVKTNAVVVYGSMPTIATSWAEHLANITKSQVSIKTMMERYRTKKLADLTNFPQQLGAELENYRRLLEESAAFADAPKVTKKWLADLTPEALISAVDNAGNAGLVRYGSLRGFEDIVGEMVDGKRAAYVMAAETKAVADAIEKELPTLDTKGMFMEIDAGPQFKKYTEIKDRLNALLYDDKGWNPEKASLMKQLMEDGRALYDEITAITKEGTIYVDPLGNGRLTLDDISDFIPGKPDNHARLIQVTNAIDDLKAEVADLKAKLKEDPKARVNTAYKDNVSLQTILKEVKQEIDSLEKIAKKLREDIEANKPKDYTDVTPEPAPLGPDRALPNPAKDSPTRSAKHTEVRAYMEDGVTLASASASRKAAAIATKTPRKLVILENGDIKVETDEGVVLVREVVVGGYDTGSYVDVHIMNDRANPKVAHMGGFTTLEFQNPIDEAFFVLGRELPPADEEFLIKFIMDNTGLLDAVDVLQIAKTVNDTVLDIMPHEKMSVYGIGALEVSYPATVKRAVGTLEDIKLSRSIYKNVKTSFKKGTQLEIMLNEKYPEDVAAIKATAEMLGLELVWKNEKALIDITHNEIYNRVSKNGKQDLVVWLDENVAVSSNTLLATARNTIDLALKRLDNGRTEVRTGGAGTMRITKRKGKNTHTIIVDADDVLNGKHNDLINEGVAGGLSHGQTAAGVAIMMAAGYVAYEAGLISEEEMQQTLAMAAPFGGALGVTKKVNTPKMPHLAIKDAIASGLRLGPIPTVAKVFPKADAETIDVINRIHFGEEGKDVYKLIYKKGIPLWEKIKEKANYAITPLTKQISGRDSRWILFGEKEKYVLSDQRQRIDEAGGEVGIVQLEDGTITHVGPITAKNAVPMFQGNKSEMVAPATKILQQTMDLGKIKVVQDHFGGGGMWSTLIAISNGLKNVIIDIAEFDELRLDRIKWTHERGDKFLQDFEESGLRVIYEKMRDIGVEDKTVSSSPIADMVRAINGEFVNKLDKDGNIISQEWSRQGALKRLHKLGLLEEGSFTINEKGKYMPVAFKSYEMDGTIYKEPVQPKSILTRQQSVLLQALFDLQARGNKLDEAGRAKVSKQLKFKDGTVADVWVMRATETYYYAKKAIDFAKENGYVKEYTYANQSSYYTGNTRADGSLWIKSGPSVLAVTDVPYFNTQGYGVGPFSTGGTWNGVGYNQTKNLMTHLKAQGNNILYTDEAWWIREDLIDVDKGLEYLDQINKDMDILVTTPFSVGSGRVEQLGVVTTSKSKKARKTIAMANTVTNGNALYDQINKKLGAKEIVTVEKGYNPNQDSNGNWGIEPAGKKDTARAEKRSNQLAEAAADAKAIDSTRPNKVGILEKDLYLNEKEAKEFEEAKLAHAEGIDPDLIASQYGWYLDKDGNWRKEFTDDTVKAAIVKAKQKKVQATSDKASTKTANKEINKANKEMDALNNAQAKLDKEAPAKKADVESAKQRMEIAVENNAKVQASNVSQAKKDAAAKRAEVATEEYNASVKEQEQFELDRQEKQDALTAQYEANKKQAEDEKAKADQAHSEAQGNAGIRQSSRTRRTGTVETVSAPNAAKVDQQWRNNVGRLPDARSGIAAEYIKMGDLPVLKHIPFIRNLRIPVEFTLARKLLGSEAPAAVRSIGASLLTVFAGFSDKSPVGAGADVHKAMLIEKYIGKWVAQYGDMYTQWHMRVNGGGKTPIKMANYSTELKRKFASDVMATKRGDPNTDISPEARETAKKWFATEEALYAEGVDIQEVLRSRGILAEDNNFDALLNSFEPDPNYAHRMFNYDHMMSLIHKLGSVDRFKEVYTQVVRGSMMSANPGLDPLKADKFSVRYVKHMMDSQHNKNIQISLTNKEELMKYMREQNKTLVENERLTEEDMEAMIEILGLQKKGRDIAKKRAPLDENFEMTLDDGTVVRFSDLTINDPALAFGAWAKELIGLTSMAKASLDFGYDLNSNRIWSQLESKMIDDMADGETIKFVRDIKNFILGDINDNGIFRQTSTAVATLNKLVDLVAGAGYAFGSLGELGAQIGLKSIDRMLRDNSVAMEIITLMRKGEFDKGLAKDLAEMTGVGAGHSNPMMRELIEKGWDDTTQHRLDQITHDAAKLNMFLAVITGTQLIGQKNMMNTLLQIKQGKEFSVKEMNILKASGYNPAMAERFNTLIAKHTKLNAEGFIESFDFQAALKTDYQAAHELSAFIYRAGKDASTEAAGVGQTPKWIHSNDVGKLMLKLQSAAMLSTSRLRRNMVDFNPDVAFKWAMSMTLASLGYAVRTYMQYYSDQEELDKRLDHKQIIAAGLRNSYMAGLAPNVIDMMFGMIGQDPPFGATSNTGRNTAQVPAQWVIGWLNGAMSTTGKAISGEQLTQDQVRSLLRSPLMAAWVPLAWLNGQFPKEKDINLED